MIAKRVHRVKGGSFKRLAGYIAKREAIKWQRTADYILDSLGAGKRASDIRITNCQAEELDEALAEITATQQRNRRAKGERTYHLVISFPEGERPSLDQLRDIEDELCAAIGLGSHQRLSAIHTDTANLHVHVAINQVHPQTLTLIEPWYDKAKLMAACERLETKHGLQRTSHRSSKRLLQGRAGDMEAHSGETSYAGWIKREVLPSLTSLLDRGGDWDALHSGLAARGLIICKRGAGLVIAEANGPLTVKASSIDRRLSFQSLSRRWGAFQEPTPKPQVPPPPAPSSPPSPPASPAAGPPSAPHAPAPVEPPAWDLLASPQAAPPVQTSSFSKIKKPLQDSPGIDALYVAYQRQRPQNLARRAEAFRRLYHEDARRREELQGWSKETAARIRRQHGQKRQEMRAALSRHQVDAASALAEQRAQSRQEWRALRESLPGITWMDFLREAAGKGNAEAAAALRRREGRYVRAIAIIHPGADWETNATVHQEFRPKADDKAITYRTADGGRIIDRSEIIYLPGDTREAVLLAFKILEARFPDSAIALIGDDAFIQKAIQIAARERPRIRFADPRHDVRRQRIAEPAVKTEHESIRQGMSR